MLFFLLCGEPDKSQSDYYSMQALAGSSFRARIMVVLMTEARGGERGAGLDANVPSFHTFLI